MDSAEEVESHQRYWREIFTWQNSRPQQAGRIGFLDLPREIRDMIYESFFTSQSVIVRRRSKVPGESNAVFCYEKYEGPVKINRYNTEAVAEATAKADAAKALAKAYAERAALLHVCRQVHVEAA